MSDIKYASFGEYLKENGIQYSESEPMSLHTTFRIGGPARALAVPEDVMSLAKLCSILKENHILVP